MENFLGIEIGGTKLQLVAGDQGYTDLKKKLARSALKPL